MTISSRGWVRYRFLLLAIGPLFGWPACAGAQIINEYAIPDSSTSTPGDITSGPDGALWFAVDDCSNGLHCNPIGQIERITTSGKITKYSVPKPYSIAAGPDGELWFTHNSGIGRITTAGVVTEHPLPSKSLPDGIVAGPGGALWFGDDGTNVIGRITTSGTITEYPLPAGCDSIIGVAITAGPDGAL
ncbi:MAG TPA: hypothetical protein VGM07_22350 [Stellaceae bacterium]|jgi:virginiamycin B lyase